MSKFFVKSGDFAPGVIRVRGEDCAHIRKVLRLGEGDLLTLCDGEGKDFLCEITAVGKEEIVTRILSSSRSESEPSVLCALFMALPKGEKMEYILQKSVELGVGLVVPVTSERCVVRLTPPEGQKKRERWQRIAEAAAKQSGRGLVPPVSAPVPFETALSMMALYQNKAVCYEGERSVSLSSCLQENMKDFAFLVGPEGGLSPKEIELCKKRGFSTVGLGKRILRTETAPLAVLSIVLYVTHNL